nr:hypothetical protein [Chloroflexia bacterium]
MRSKAGLDGAPDVAADGVAPSALPSGVLAGLRGIRFPLDLIGVLVLLVVTALVVWPPLTQDWPLGRTDALIYFIPLWGYLGEQLRAGNIPAWNPAQFGGMPFAGDPESGWMYLPTMVVSTLLPAVAAFKTLVLVHLSLAALGTYVLGRVLGLGMLAAVVAGAAYEFSALLE